LNFVCAFGRPHSPWNRYHYPDPLRQSMELETIIGAELVLQPRAGGRDADAFLQRRERVLRKPDAVVAHFEPEHVVVAPRGDVDVTRA